MLKSLACTKLVQSYKNFLKVLGKGHNIFSQYEVQDMKHIIDVDLLLIIFVMFEHSKRFILEEFI